MKKIALSILAVCISICLIQPLLKAEDSYEISKYFPIGIGNEWRYTLSETGRGKPSGHIIHSVIRTKDLLNGKEVYLLEREMDKTRDRDRNPIFYYSLGEEGIYLHKVAKDGGDIVFSQPAIAFPDNLQLNQGFKDSRAFVVYDTDGNIVDRGMATAEIKFQGFEDVTVPAGRFEDCLVIFSFLKIKGSSMVVITTTWLAQGVGKVKENEEITEYGGAVSKIYTEIELTGGMIEGKNIGDFAEF